MSFKETLPTGCPPTSSHGNGCNAGYRFVMTDTVSAEDFASHAAKGEDLPTGVDLCRFSSCSLYPSMDVVLKKRKLKRLQQYSFVAQISIPPGSGMIVESSNHIDFWMYSEFDPVGAVVQIHGLPNG